MRITPMWMPKNPSLFEKHKQRMWMMSALCIRKEKQPTAQIWVSVNNDKVWKYQLEKHGEVKRCLRIHGSQRVFFYFLFDKWKDRDVIYFNVFQLLRVSFTSFCKRLVHFRSLIQRAVCESDLSQMKLVLNISIPKRLWNSLADNASVKGTL